MRLGLLADIHEAVGPLGAAVRELERRGVESFVMLGDVLDAGELADETVALLKELPGVGVWVTITSGNCSMRTACCRGRGKSRSTTGLAIGT
jgi:predicted phosphodiesterase